PQRAGGGDLAAGGTHRRRAGRPRGRLRARPLCAGRQRCGPGNSLAAEDLAQGSQGTDRRDGPVQRAQGLRPRRGRRLAAGESGAAGCVHRLAGARPQLRRTGASLDRAGRGGGGPGWRPAPALRSQPSGPAPANRAGRWPGRRGGPRRAEERHAEPRQVQPRSHRPRQARQARSRDRPRAGDSALTIPKSSNPMLARGELNLIGATTLNEYQKHIEKDAALERRFQPVLVSEPTVEQTITILRGLRDTFEAHHKVTITDEAIVAAAELSDRYIRGRYMPDKAIDVIDQSAARVRLRGTSRPAEIMEVDAALQQARRERDFARTRKNHERTK